MKLATTATPDWLGTATNAAATEPPGAAPADAKTRDGFGRAILDVLAPTAAAGATAVAAPARHSPNVGAAVDVKGIFLALAARLPDQQASVALDAAPAGVPANPAGLSRGDASALPAIAPRQVATTAAAAAPAIMPALTAGPSPVVLAAAPARPGATPAAVGARTSKAVRPQHDPLDDSAGLPVVAPPGATLPIMPPPIAAALASAAPASGAATAAAVPAADAVDAAAAATSGPAVAATMTAGDAVAPPGIMAAAATDLPDTVPVRSGHRPAAASARVVGTAGAAPAVSVPAVPATASASPSVPPPGSRPNSAPLASATGSRSRSGAERPETADPGTAIDVQPGIGREVATTAVTGSPTASKIAVSPVAPEPAGADAVAHSTAPTAQPQPADATAGAADVPLHGIATATALAVAVPPRAHDPATAVAAPFAVAAAPVAPAADPPATVPSVVVPTRPAALAHDVGLAIARQLSADGNTLHIRLDPAELGRIDVRMSFDDRGNLRAVVAADSASALDLLRRDSADLGRAMSDAGVRSDSQSFRFEGRGGDGGQQRQTPFRFAITDADADTVPAAPDPTRFRPLRWRGQIDVLA